MAGFGENSRVLKWIIGRLECNTAAGETPIGRGLSADELDLSGLDAAREDIGTTLNVDAGEWFDSISDALAISMGDEFEASSTGSYNDRSGLGGPAFPAVAGFRPASAGCWHQRRVS